MAPKRGRGGRTGGRGNAESQGIVGDLKGQGLTVDEAREALKNMGFTTSRRSQLLKGYMTIATSSSSKPADSAPAREAGDGRGQEQKDHAEECCMGFKGENKKYWKSREPKEPKVPKRI